MSVRTRRVRRAFFSGVQQLVSVATDEVDGLWSALRLAVSVGEGCP